MGVKDGACCTLKGKGHEGRVIKKKGRDTGGSQERTAVTTIHGSVLSSRKGVHRHRFTVCGSAHERTGEKGKTRDVYKRGHRQHLAGKGAKGRRL